MPKDTITAKLIRYEKERNKRISKSRYIIEHYFGLNHLHDNGYTVRFATIEKSDIDIWLRQVSFNIKRGLRMIGQIKA